MKRRITKSAYLFNQATNEGVVFTRNQARGAIPNSTLVEKINTEPGDGHKDGAPAHVLGSVGPVDGYYGYFIEWLDKPGIPCFIKSNRIRVM